MNRSGALTCVVVLMVNGALWAEARIPEEKVATEPVDNKEGTGLTDVVEIDREMEEINQKLKSDNLTPSEKEHLLKKKSELQEAKDSILMEFQQDKVKERQELKDRTRGIEN